MVSHEGSHTIYSVSPSSNHSWLAHKSSVAAETPSSKARGNAMANSLSMYSVTENIYYSQLSSVGLLLQPEPLSHRIVQGKDWVLSPHALSPCGLPLPPTCLLVTVNEARWYFASTIHGARCSSRSETACWCHRQAVCPSTLLVLLVESQCVVFNPLRPSGNYINHMLCQSLMLHFVFIGFQWFSL
jgi:hypothetical protein